MAQLEVTVNKLNRRKSPVTDFADKSNVVEVVSKGFIFESVAQIENNLGIWHQDIDGLWAWEKGLTKESLSEVYNKIIDYNLKSSLPIEFKNTGGKDITIGILDTGCFNHTAFIYSNIKGKNFVDNSDDFEDVSLESHGTFVSGIIAAGACKNNEMKGVAINTSLIIAKITAESEISDSDFVLKGLDWLVKQRPDIINCSFDFSPSINKSKFDEIFFSNEAKNIIWVASGQDGVGVFNNTAYYPASNKNFIAVGALKMEDLANNTINNINSCIKYIVPQLPFKSTDKFDSYSDCIGSSFASALVAGNLALIKSKLKQNALVPVTPIECIDLLDENIGKLTSASQLQTPFLIFKR